MKPKKLLPVIAGLLFIAQSVFSQFTPHQIYFGDPDEQWGTTVTWDNINFGYYEAGGGFGSLIGNAWARPGNNCGAIMLQKFSAGLPGVDQFNDNMTINTPGGVIHVMVGSVPAAGGGNDIIAVGMNGVGGVVFNWRINIGTDDVAMAVCPSLLNNRIVIAGMCDNVFTPDFDAFILQLNYNTGLVNWCNILRGPGNFDQAVDVMIKPGNTGYYLVGNTDDYDFHPLTPVGDIFVLDFNISGTYLAGGSAAIGDDDLQEVKSAVINPVTNEIIMTGFSMQGTIGGADGVVVAYNPLSMANNVLVYGSADWDRGNAVIYDPDAVELVVAGMTNDAAWTFGGNDGTLMRLDANPGMAFNWARHYGASGSEELTDIAYANTPFKLVIGTGLTDSYNTGGTGFSDVWSVIIDNMGKTYVCDNDIWAPSLVNDVWDVDPTPWFLVTNLGAFTAVAGPGRTTYAYEPDVICCTPLKRGDEMQFSVGADDEKTTISPVPASDFIRLSGAAISGQGELIIYDSQGRVVVQKGDYLPGEPISVQELYGGVYFVTFRNGTGLTSTGRFMKE